jgi:hypothetical protein
LSLSRPRVLIIAKLHIRKINVESSYHVDFATAKRLNFLFILPIMKVATAKLANGLLLDDNWLDRLCFRIFTLNLSQTQTQKNYPRLST